MAIHLKIDAFERYLKNAVASSFQEGDYADRAAWQNAVKNSNIRLQWDPDHDPYGAKLDRRAIQIGIRNEDVKTYAKADILKIENISDLVKTQYQHVLNNNLDGLLVPEEKPYIPRDIEVRTKLKIEL